MLRDGFSRGRIQEQFAIIVAAMFEVEHLRDRVADGIERSLTDPLSTEPVVLNEVNDRGLVGDRVIDKVLSRPWRDHKQRLTWAITAASLRMLIACIDARQRAAAVAASSRAAVRASAGLVD